MFKKKVLREFTPEQLVTGLKSGDDEAVSYFWETYFSEICKICNRIVNSAMYAEDIAIDLLNDVILTHVHNVKNANGLRRYLRLAAVRRSVRFRDNLRKHKSIDEVDNMVPLSSPPVNEILFEGDTLNYCLSKLSPRNRAAIRGKYTDGATNAEIGKLTGLTKQHVGRVLKSSLDFLTECMNRKRQSHG